MDKLLWMHCFVRAVETGSFSAVARELGIGQPNVSRHIASLEKTLATRLLHRSTRHMVATPEGQRYYTQARQALDVIAEAEADARGLQRPHGLLRVTCTPNLGTEKIIGALPAFLAQYPDVEIDLRLNDGYVDLVAEGIDVALRGDVPTRRARSAYAWPARPTWRGTAHRWCRPTCSNISAWCTP